MSVRRTKRRAKEVQQFTHLVQVCMAHRAVWCTHALSNQAMAALFNAVDMLVKEQFVVDEPPLRRVQGRGRAIELPLLAERLAGIYTLLYAEPSVRELAELGRGPVPPRSAIPTGPDALVAFAAGVRTTLKEDAGLRARAGIHYYHLLNLNTSIKRCAPVKPPPHRIDTYARQLNSCLRHLLERVDPVMVRFAEHKAFSTAYKTARRPLLKLEVAARKYVRST